MKWKLLSVLECLYLFYLFVLTVAHNVLKTHEKYKKIS